ncbi:UNVERIFIED_CONTAM: hypothetical protein Slati_4592300 [Sesamum latifolium]|uniref:Uncharacterized protein n=1 Tax=Sesamum latifolium TaxID=2727402 RepID=A0AAW2S3D7_9LAMI
MEQCRQGKSAKWIRNLGKRIGSEGWARGSQFRTRRLSANCSSCSRGESGSSRAGRGRTGNGPLGGLPRASNSRLRTAKPQPRERAWRNQRGKKTLLSLTLVRLCEMT